LELPPLGEKKTLVGGLGEHRRWGMGDRIPQAAKKKGGVKNNFLKGGLCQNLSCVQGKIKGPVIRGKGTRKKEGAVDRCVQKVEGTRIKKSDHTRKGRRGKDVEPAKRGSSP